MADKQESQQDGATQYPIDSRVWRIRDMPERLRPREEMERLGAGNAADDVLLAILLRTGVKGMNVRDLAASMLRQYGSLTALSACSVEELCRIKGIRKIKAQVLAAAFEIAKRLNEERLPKQMPVKSPEDVAAAVGDRARSLEYEVFWILLLDNRNRLKTRPVEVSRGLLDASLVHPREVFKEAVRSASAALIMAHNHPSGDPSPSAEDIKITRQLVEAGKIMDIKVLDHVILGRSPGDGARSFVSMREEGLVSFG